MLFLGFRGEEKAVHYQFSRLREVQILEKDGRGPLGMELPPSFEARETAGTGPLILGIGGPTRSGKTILALNLARMFTGSRYGGPEADFDAAVGRLICMRGDRLRPVIFSSALQFSCSDA